MHSQRIKIIQLKFNDWIIIGIKQIKVYGNKEKDR